MKRTKEIKKKTQAGALPRLRSLTMTALFLCLSAQFSSAAWDWKASPAQGQGQGVSQKTSAQPVVWSRGPMNNPQQNALSHWEKHRAEFPELKSAEAYIAKAHAFYKNPPKGTLKKKKYNQELLYYHPKSNTFAVYSSRGVPQTLFRPRAKIQYWNRQEGEVVK